MATLEGGLRDRMLLESILQDIKADLVARGWFTLGREHGPITIVETPSLFPWGIPTLLQRSWVPRRRRCTYRSLSTCLPRTTGLAGTLSVTSIPTFRTLASSMCWTTGTLHLPSSSGSNWWMAPLREVSPRGPSIRGRSIGIWWVLLLQRKGRMHEKREFNGREPRGYQRQQMLSFYFGVSGEERV